MNEIKTEIFNRTYILRGEKSAADLRRVAREVDYRMKEVSDLAPNLDVARTAVLTALNLAEEYLELQERYDRVVKMLEDEHRRREAAGEPEEESVIPMRRQQEEARKEKGKGQ